MPALSTIPACGHPSSVAVTASCSSSPCPLPAGPHSKSLSISVPSLPLPASLLPGRGSASLPSLPAELTDPSQLCLFHPHHYFGRTVDRLTAYAFSAQRPRRFHMASLRSARQLCRRCVRCGLDPRQFDGVVRPSATRPRVARSDSVDARGSRTPDARSTTPWLVDCARAPRTPRYSIAFLRGLARDQEDVNGTQQLRAGKRRRADAGEEREDSEGGGQQRKRSAVSWESADVARLSSSWSALPPLPAAVSHRGALPSPQFAQSPPLSPLGSLRAMTAMSTASGLPLSPVSLLSRALQRSCMVGRPGDARIPTPFIRLTDTAALRPKRKQLPPVPILEKEGDLGVSV